MVKHGQENGELSNVVKSGQSNKVLSEVIEETESCHMWSRRNRVVKCGQGNEGF